MRTALRPRFILLFWLFSMLISMTRHDAFAQCPTTISDANFADAIRTIYPALIGPAGDNALTAAAATYTGELDFRGWGNPTLTSGANSEELSAARRADRLLLPRHQCRWGIHGRSAPAAAPLCYA